MYRSSARVIVQSPLGMMYEAQGLCPRSVLQLLSLPKEEICCRSVSHVIHRDRLARHRELVRVSRSGAKVDQGSTSMNVLVRRCYRLIPYTRSLRSTTFRTAGGRSTRRQSHLLVSRTIPIASRTMASTSGERMEKTDPGSVANPLGEGKFIQTAGCIIIGYVTSLPLACD